MKSSKPKIKNEDLIYIQLSPEEAVDSKKELLSLEMYFLKLAKIINSYNAHRQEELRIKADMHKKIKNVKLKLKKLQTILPTLKIPELLKKNEDYDENRNEHNGKRKKTLVKTGYGDDLEFQLKEIQEKLNSLQK